VYKEKSISSMPSPEVGHELEFTMGSPFPLGATLQRGSANFAVFSKHATAVTLALFRDDSSGVVSEFALDPRCNMSRATAPRNTASTS
jgi:pullulanase/glycogen debranching enzyme